MVKTSPFALLALLLSGVCQAQTKRLVDPVNGPYLTIQSAIDAAKPGDLIEVRGGLSFQGATCSKGVHIYGTATFDISTDLVLKGIPKGQHAHLSGFRMREPSLGAGRSLQILDCAGTVHVHAVDGRGGSGPALSVQNSAHVTITDSSFQAHAVSIWNRLSWIGSSVVIGDSSVSMQRCSATGRFFSYWDGRKWSTYSCPGIAASGSRLALVDCVATGASRYWIDMGPFGRIYFGPFAGVEAAQGSTLVVKRVQATGGTATTPGLRADGSSRIVKDTATNVTVGGPTATQDIYDLRATGSAPGGVVPITVTGTGTVPFAVFAGHPARPVFGPPADIWLDLSAPVLLYADALNGRHTTLVRTPRHLPVGLSVCLQAVVLTGRRLESSTPAVIALR